MTDEELREFFLPFQRDETDYYDYCSSLSRDEINIVCAKHIASTYFLASVLVSLLDRDNETEIEF